MLEEPLTAIAAILVLGVAAQLVAWQLRIPSILVLLGLGVLVGPAFGLLDPDELFGDLLLPIVSLSAAVILFEGGLSLDLRILKGSNWVVWRLITLGLVLTAVIAGASAHLLFDIDWAVAALLGAIMVVTGPTVIGPLLSQIRPIGATGHILRAEGIMVDPLGVLLAIVVFEVVLAGSADEATAEIVATVLRTVVGGLVIGLAAAALLVLAFSRFVVPDHLHNVLALGLVMLVFAIADQVQEESGLFAVTVLGIALATQRWAPVHHLSEFSETLRLLLIAGLFIVLGARIQPGDIPSVALGGIGFLGVLVLVARPLSVLVSTFPSRLERRERLFLASVAPRGIVAAAVASVFAIRLGELDNTHGAELMVPITFIVIVGTIALYGLGAGPLARKLGLADENPQGVLIVGAHDWARDLGDVLDSLGVKVVLIDTERRNIAAARLSGLRTVYGSILGERTFDDVDLAGIGRLLALTPSEELNAFAVQRFIRLFGRRDVYQLAPELTQDGDRRAIDRRLRGRLLGANDLTFESISSRYQAGARFKVTRLGEAFDAKFQPEQNGNQAFAMFRIDRQGGLGVYTTDRRPSAQPGDSIVSLVDGEMGEQTKST